MTGPSEREKGAANVEYAVLVGLLAAAVLTATLALATLPTIVLLAAGGVAVAVAIALLVAKRYRFRRDRVAGTLGDFAEEELHHVLSESRPGSDGRSGGAEESPETKDAAEDWRPTRITEAKGSVAFPPSAVQQLHTEVGRYVSELVRETERMAEQGKADHASPKHVEMASERLAPGMRRKSEEVASGLGGAAFGAGLSAWASLAGEDVIPRFEAAIATLLLLIGASLFTYRIGRL